MSANERILLLMKEKGPVIPVQLSKEIKDSILMTSARLSELLSSKKIKISANVKVGGSPLYYLAGQESMLQNFSNNLGNVEKKAYDLISQGKVLRDSMMEPAIRVALRQIKDFAIPLNVFYNNAYETFWKWYLMDNVQAEVFIKDYLSKAQSAPEKLVEKGIEESSTKVVNYPATEIPISSPANKEINIPKNENKSTIAETQKELVKKEEPKKLRKIGEKANERHAANFFAANKLSIIESLETKKSAELEFIVELRTSIGEIRYFCKYKSKKKINDSDLSSALVQAQSKSLPLLFLSNGALSSKASDMLNKEFKGIIFKKV